MQAQVQILANLKLIAVLMLRVDNIPQHTPFNFIIVAMHCLSAIYLLYYCSASAMQNESWWPFC